MFNESVSSALEARFRNVLDSGERAYLCACGGSTCEELVLRIAECLSVINVRHEIAPLDSVSFWVVFDK